MPFYATALLAPAAVAFAVSATVVWMLLKTHAGRFALDKPNARSLHATAVPRVGGIGILAGILAAAIYAAHDTSAPLTIAFTAVVAVSLVDDLRGLNAVMRLPIHLAAAALAAVSLLGAHAPWPWLLSATLAIAWMANLYNFMDGSDGLAGGMAVFGFSACAMAAVIGGDVAFAAMNLAIAAAAAGFLWFNFPPARVFMGDAGSVPLGFLAAVSGIDGWVRGNWPLWFGVLVFSPFILDATVTLAKRLVRGERIWQAHCEHYYQRLVRCGWGHRKTALAGYALMVACGALALLGAYLSATAQATLLVIAGAAYLGIVLILERKLHAVP
jgi:UDP-N-acetylmuramyl pentapeptide phosphotransferase/UDP-N-acetylglucosamine-1-phosphate transferase